MMKAMKAMKTFLLMINMGWYSWAAPVFQPSRISFQELVSNESFNAETFKTAMTKVGLISVTGLFANDSEGRQIKSNTLSYLHQCAVDADITEVRTFDDGTVRRTLATHSIPDGIQPFSIDGSNISNACKVFTTSSYAFRQKVAAATTAFANRLKETFDSPNSSPLLFTASGYSFNNVADIVKYGEHLEHFHSYQKNNVDSQTNAKNGTTIEWHTDQGLFIAFTPGLKVSSNENRYQKEEVSSGLSILLEDGTSSLVGFNENDDLVFMMGDGFNQYVNSRSDKAIKIRAVPHSLTMPQQNMDEARAWYGLMVLPPFDALHPDYDTTFGELRERTIESSSSTKSDDAVMSMSCSGAGVARQLLTCTNNTLLCWHQCMSLTAYNVSEAICASKNLELKCGNPRGEAWDNTHGDFYPQCLKKNATLNSPEPRLPNYPRSNTTCSSAGFQAFAAPEDFKHSYKLPDLGGKGSGALFMWTVSGKKVKARIALNNIFGWLAFGYANAGGAKNGMHGGKVLMATPGGNYSPLTGFDLKIKPSAGEYTIDPDGQKASFRFWSNSKPVESGGKASVKANDCYTRMDFTLTTIGGKAFNLTGEDHVMWAGNAIDYFAGYHGNDRSSFYINWAKGTGRVWVNPANGTSTYSPIAPPSSRPCKKRGKDCTAGAQCCSKRCRMFMRTCA